MIPPADFGAHEDHLQHGRKFTAKRRQLPENAESSEEHAENTQNMSDMDTSLITQANENTPAAVTTPDVQTQSQGNWDQGGEEQTENAEIQFGRGRR
jgi:hypothetical protein